MAPERLDGWLARFGERHGIPVAAADGERARLECPDGAVAVLATRWPGPVDPDDPVGSLTVAALRPRRLGVLLVRRERHAIGLAEDASVTEVAVGRHRVQGRTKAGGWSQQRYARRRDNQARQAFASAAADAARLLEPVADSLDGLLRGGDAPGLDAVLTDARLSRTAALAARVVLPRLEVGPPDRAALLAFPGRYRAVVIRLSPLAL